jgi:protein phosphatase
MQILSFSEKGSRQQNEDIVLSKKLNENISVHIVADGMGGYENGAIAAKTVVDTILEFIKDNLTDDSNIVALIKNAINQSNRHIQNLRTQYNNKMGATLAGLLLIRNQAYCFWVGDVRIYHFKENKIHFQSKDHSLINVLLNIDQILTPSEAQQYRHIVTKSIQGNKEIIEPNIELISNLSISDKFILCTDGVHSVIKPSELEFMLKSTIDFEKLLFLVKDICMKESKDNYTALYTQFSFQSRFSTTISCLIF